MTVRFSRRDALLQTAAMAAANVMPGVCFPGVAAPLRALSHSGEIDAVLRKSVEAAEGPGVVPMAATAQSAIYQGAVGGHGDGPAPKVGASTVFRTASLLKLLAARSSSTR